MEMEGTKLTETILGPICLHLNFGTAPSSKRLVANTYIDEPHRL